MYDQSCPIEFPNGNASHGVFHIIFAPPCRFERLIKFNVPLERRPATNYLFFLILSIDCQPRRRRSGRGGGRRPGTYKGPEAEGTKLQI